ncbi:conserved hypothetical protein [Desulfamplus magnetovallimortis]|uniref:Putative restriction endonuclease domain-containing protein n=1 Tax=Desulfamplus magnetovallimortis TaxID=1246637 RepID=A0A1W1HFH7_9BACT|nr:Uma2 family endonuclease [Desulfamplus magnetovallimortis]SLM31186.1 conserved hypothetical protein [Desulfamplus magnetovallimortis]
MNAQPQEKPLMNMGEYLELERNSKIKHEYFNGEIFAMVGAKKNHILIGANLTAELRNRFKAKNSTCKVLPNDMRVKIDNDKGYTGYTYPDIAITCGSIEFEDNEFDTLTNPIVIIEILSDSTEAFDRGDKFAYYRGIPTLKEYILVSQKRCRIEKFVRENDGLWSLFLYEEIKQTMKIDSIDCELPLSEIYWEIEF